ncbi:MAG: bifunctional DNA-formamidopyrimidine glycosylase/DNA-(apurinic or apyrimidinic site) lyase [Candidatus Shapirobacteria bacterium]|nr:bifunctional DNA-formamidopyrimidine glycosylase/DNA-(apurinic or apyrimidinic site) lyase [Candidatus Shapirobacteria bacterium]
MPELPEVEVVKLFLEDKLLNSTITDLEILNKKSFIGDPKKVINQKIVKFSRIGKQLSIHLSNKLILLVHLKMTGQLIFHPSLSREGKGVGFMLGHPTSTINSKSTRLIFKFNNGSVLFFNDQRKFGWIKILSPRELTESQLNLGKDIFDSEFTPQYLYSQLQTSSRPVKLVLLDQNKFAGIGNIYANDALFLAKIHPQTSSKKITLNQAKLIHQSLIDIMRQSILAGGSTAKDNKYVRPDGSFGQNQFKFRVYQRLGEPCLVCSTPIKKLQLGGRGTFYCPQCQKL